MTIANDQKPPADEGRLDLPVVPLVERLRELSRRGYWPLIGDEAADEIERLQQELGECSVGWESGTKAIAENLVLRQALNKIAERTGSDDPCRALVQIARDALRHNAGNEGPAR